MDVPGYYAMAVERVDSTPELQPYRRIMLDYYWSNYEDHVKRVATAPLEELLEWAQSIREDDEGDGPAPI